MTSPVKKSQAEAAIIRLRSLGQNKEADELQARVDSCEGDYLPITEWPDQEDFTRLQLRKDMKNQLHTDFEIFVGKPSNNGLDNFSQDLTSFVSSNQVSAKSIGVEYLEASGDVVISLGYCPSGPTEPYYPVKLTSLSIGKFAMPLDGKAVARAMKAAALHVTNVICHEFYVKEDGEFFVVFLSLL